MHDKKLGRIAAVVLSVLSLSFVGASNGGWGDLPQGGWGDLPQGGWGRDPGQEAEKDGVITESTEVTQPEEAPAITIENESGTKILYLDALTKDMSVNQKFVTLKRGNYTSVMSLGATVEYPVKQEYVVTVPYGTIYLMGINNELGPRCEKGDVLAWIQVEVDMLEMERISMQVARFEERGITTGYYTYLKNMLDGMKQALTQTEITIEEDGYLVEHDWAWRGEQISEFRYVLADPAERMISVENQNNQFRYGQKVTVTGTLDSKKVTGTGTVISASSRVIDSELSNEKAYIKLDGDSTDLYDASGLSVSVESIHVENILLLDAGCVFMKNGVQMVKIKDENGVHISGFVSGRKSPTQYWIVDGLSEGTEVLVQ